MTLRATVRLQLHAGFTFDDAAATVDYYAALGISHFYTSPIFAAREGSTHGYDIVDPARISPALGGEAALQRLVKRLHAAGMGLVIDVVPNHMGVADPANRYWQDVLAWGSGSRYAHWFDIDWHAPQPHLNGKLQLPVLGERYERVMQQGHLGLHFEPQQGRLSLTCYDQRFPLSPASQGQVLQTEPELQTVAALFENADADTLPECERQLAALADNPAGARAIAAALARFSPATAAGLQALHRVLTQQHYHLSWWRNAAEEINWRRFFEVSELAGVCVELDDVFEATHAQVFALYARGWIDGVRIDHVDGLAQPAAYGQQLRRRLHALNPSPSPSPSWIVVEKILSPGESLPAAWGFDGTTGYDFMDSVGQLLHDSGGEPVLRADWLALTADTLTFDAHVQAARLQLLNAHFGGELDALARALHGCARASEPLSQDISLPAVRRVLLAFLAAFRRYRTASTLAVCSVEDKRVLAEAQTRAQQSLPAPDHALLAQLAHWLGLADPAQDEPEAQTIRRARAMTRFEQLTPPLAAKSVEDTTFYRYAPLLSRNEVGSFPETVAAGVAEFHAANAARASAFPNSLLATATHDHKRGEDQRARLAVLSEIPHEWGALLRRWMAAHAGWRATLAQPGGGVLLAPSPADEIMLYQTLLGAWPPALRADDAPALKAFAARIHMWQEKALREAKTHTSWMLPQADYENSCRAFTSRLLDPAFGGAFLHELQALVDTIAPAALSNSLSQTVLRLTVPGIPDLYQGTEWADFSLVDPDNRRPVDMDARRAALPGLTALPPQPGYARKQQLIAQLLAWRARHAEVFAEGRYQPLQVTGPLARHVVAFARHSPRTNTAVIVLAVRLAWTLAHLPAANRWHGTVVQLSDGLPTSGTCLLTDAPWSAEHGQLRLDDLLDHDSVAVLVGNVEGLPAQTDQKP